MDEADNTVYVGNLDSNVTDSILYELFLQAGPVQSVNIPMDKKTNQLKSFAFVSFKDTESVPYAFYLLDGIKLFNKRIKVQKRNANSVVPPMDNVGIHSLDPDHFSDKKVHGLPLPTPQLSDVYKNQSFGNSPLFNMIPPPYPLYQMMGFNHPGNTPNGSSYNNGYPNSSSIDTNSLNNFKNNYDNRYSPYEQKRHGNSRANQDRNFGPSHLRNDKRNFDDAYYENRNSPRNESRSNLEGRLHDNRHFNSRRSYDNRHGSPNSSHGGGYGGNNHRSKSYQDRRYQDHRSGDRYH